MSEEPTFLTPAAHKKMEQELEHLKTKGREEISDAFAVAVYHGYLRVIAEYDAAKNEQGLMEARIRKLEHLLRTAEVRDVVDSGRVEVGSVVTVVDGDGDEMQYFVAPQENKVPGLLLASPTSPLGGALLGAGVGDEVAYDAPAGTLKVTIKAVRPYEGPESN
jgi:transcription elongation factor GreA